MKKIISIIFLIAETLFLSSCGKEVNNGNLEFPKTAWGMSVEETFDSCGITKTDTNLYEEGGRGTAFRIVNYPLFGENASEIIFNYIDFADNGTMELCAVRAVYPENADMDHVLKNMKKSYGATIPDITGYLRYSVFGDVLEEKRYVESENLKIWADKTVAESIGKGNGQDYEKPWEFFQTGLNADTWDEFSQNARMVKVTWSTEENVNTLDFDAYNLCVYRQLKSQLSE